MPENSKRLSILNSNEIEELYGQPAFNNEERESFFTLSEDEWYEYSLLRRDHSRVYFLLQLGYIKARQFLLPIQFNDAKEDVSFICAKYKIFTPVTELPSKNARGELQKTILKLMDLKAFTIEDYEYLLSKAASLGRVHIQPRFIFTELLRIVKSLNVTLPGYSTFQKLVSHAISNEYIRLKVIARKELPSEVRKSLTKLLESDTSMAELSSLKKRARDFKLKHIKAEVKKHESIKPLYEFSRKFLPSLEISNENIKYYSSLAEFYPVNKLESMPRMQSYIYLLCFIKHCYEQISDNLVSSFIYQVSSILQDAKLYAQQRILERNEQGKSQLVQTKELIHIFIDDTIDEEQPFREVKKRAFSIADKDEIKDVIGFLDGERQPSAVYEWEYICQSAHKIKVNIRPLFMAISFGSNLSLDPLISCCNTLKSIIHRKIDKWGELTQIADKYLKRSKSWIEDKGQYEFLIYQLLKNGLEAGDIFFSESTRYKSFEEDLISKEDWKKKEKTIQGLDLPLIYMPMKQRLKMLKEQLDKGYKKLHREIKNGEHDLKLSNSSKGNQKWTIPYSKQEEKANNPFYEKLPQTNIISVLKFVHSQCGFLNAFKHIQPRYSKSTPDISYLLACIISYGERFGIEKMANISDIKGHLLRTSANNYLRLETTRKANDMIVNATSQLPIFKHFNLDVGTLHASADGQKFETNRDVFKARYSPKYFGLNKGLVNYSLVVNHVPANAKVIGANEHESHFAFDIVFNNSSEVNPDIISVDMAGTNQVNFAILETFGRSWAPRYKSINKKETKLVSFSNPSDYPANMLIKPFARVNEKLILSEEENIHRIFASLALKETSQSTVVRKLSSYNRTNRTKKALWELDNIYMSLYILDYLSNPLLRTNVQRALNRGESYHQLHRSITQPSGGKFRGTTESEIAIENDCTRLIANSIIFYNSLMLSMLLKKVQKEGDPDQVKFLARLSPVAWRHINMYGKFEFNQKIVLPDFKEIIASFNLKEII